MFFSDKFPLRDMVVTKFDVEVWKNVRRNSSRNVELIILPRHDVDRKDKRLRREIEKEIRKFKERKARETERLQIPKIEIYRRYKPKQKKTYEKLEFPTGVSLFYPKNPVDLAEKDNGMDFAPEILKLFFPIESKMEISDFGTYTDYEGCWCSVTYKNHWVNLVDVGCLLAVYPNLVFNYISVTISIRNSAITKIDIVTEPSDDDFRTRDDEDENTNTTTIDRTSSDGKNLKRKFSELKVAGKRAEEGEVEGKVVSNSTNQQLHKKLRKKNTGNNGDTMTTPKLIIIDDE